MQAGRLVEEWFKWGRRERPGIDQLIAERRGLARRLVSLELWGQIHLNGQRAPELAERMRAVRR